MPYRLEGADSILGSGAVKASIGHLEGAAGIAGVIKTILVLERGVIPPIAQLGQLNSEIDAEFLKLKVGTVSQPLHPCCLVCLTRVPQFPTAVAPWPKPGLRRASVSSFGFGGTNAHAVLDDAFHYLQSHGMTAKHRTNVPVPLDLMSLRLLREPLQPARRDSATPKLFTWSANEPNAVMRMCEAYRTHLETQFQKGEMTEDKLEALAYTLSEKRSLLPWRSFAVAGSISQLLEGLQAPTEALQALAEPKAGFVFTGQGAQWLGMSRELFAFPAFRDSLLNADAFLLSLGCDWNASDVLQGRAGQPSINIDEPRFAQPLCTIIQVAMVELLRTLGIYPATVIGHSSGEIAAAYTIGAISRESAWKLAYLRGLLSSQLAESSGAGTSPRGSMMAVGLSESSVRPFIDDTLGPVSSEGILMIACVNSPNNVTVSGDEELVRELQSRLNQEGVFTRVLRVPVAYHSPHMEAIASPYEQLIGTLSHGEEPAQYATMISSVTGDHVDAGELQQAQYWVRNMVSPVRFSSAVERLCHHSAKKTKKKLDMSHRKCVSVAHLLEIGPHSALQGPIRQTRGAVSPTVNISYTPALVRGRGAAHTLLDALGKLHCLGFSVDLVKTNNMAASFGATKGLPVGPSLTLPEYPFDNTQTYWREPWTSKNLRSQSQPYSEFLGLQAADWNPLEPRWRNVLRASSIPWVQDHKINGEILYPAAGMWVMAVEAITRISTGQKIVGYELRDTAMLSSLIIPADDTEVEVQFRLKPILDSSNKSVSWADFSLFACRNENNYVEICRGSIKAVFAAQGQGDSQGGSDGSPRQMDHTRDIIQRAKLAYSLESTSEELYARLDSNGYQYGALFHGIQIAQRSGDGQAVGEVALCHPPPSASASRTPPTVIHPCDLDSILQLCLPAIVRARENDTKKETWVPTYLSKLWLPASGFRGRVQVHASTQARSTRLCESSIQAVTLEPSSCDDGVLLISGAELTLIASHQQSSHAKPPSRLRRRLCYDLIRSPDISLLTPLETSRYIHSHPSLPPDPTDFLRTLKLYILCSMSRAVSSTPFSFIPDSRPHLQKQHLWMQSILASATAQPAPGLPADWAAHLPDAPFEALSARLETMSRLGAIHVAFGRHAPAVLRGDADPLEILTRDDTLKEYYALFNQSLKFFAPMARYLDLLAHKNPGMKILEVGAGTGVTTAEVLRTLVGGGSGVGGSRWCRFGRYDFTDLSPAFFDKVEKEEGGVLAGLGERMQFAVLDVESDAVEQGFEEASYDLCIAVNVSVAMF